MIDMIFWTLLVGLYVLVAAFAAYMTRQEQKRQDQPSLAYSVMGYVACTLWPLVAIAVFLSAHSRPASFSPAELD